VIDFGLACWSHILILFCSACNCPHSWTFYCNLMVWLLRKYLRIIISGFLHPSYLLSYFHYFLTAKPQHRTRNAKAAWRYMQLHRNAHNRLFKWPSTTNRNILYQSPFFPLTFIVSCLMSSIDRNALPIN
jgi:hypothetical protein